MKKNILLVLVGGTICTDVNESGSLSISEKAGVLLKENYLNSDAPFVGEVAIDLTENLFILSEDMTVARWNTLLDVYRREEKKKRYDGVVFAHGTDSLAYSAALFSLLLSKTNIPIFFVSSNERLASPRANGNANFRCAVDCICRGIVPNVYVSYQNLSDGVMYLHLASRLEQCKNYSEDFYSAGALSITDSNWAQVFQTIEKNYPRRGRSPVGFPQKPLLECVLMITPYVGLNYNAFNLSGFSAVLQGTYHSGTVCTEMGRYSEKYGENSFLHLVELCLEKHPNMDIYMAPARFFGELYETVHTIKNYRGEEKDVSFLYGMTQEMAYVKLLVAYSLLDDKEAIQQFLKTSINFEYAYE